ncbi:MAG: hypothetical protein AAF557_17550 [Pseudomonadota bacterium]
MKSISKNFAIAFPLLIIAAFFVAGLIVSEMAVGAKGLIWTGAMTLAALWSGISFARHNSLRPKMTDIALLKGRTEK